MLSGPNERIGADAYKQFTRLLRAPKKTVVVRGCAWVVPVRRRQRRPARHSSQGRGLARGDFIGA
jgi:hypothetical protein